MNRRLTLLRYWISQTCASRGNRGGIFRLLEPANRERCHAVRHRRRFCCVPQVCWLPGVIRLPLILKTGVVYSQSSPHQSGRTTDYCAVAGNNSSYISELCKVSSIWITSNVSQKQSRFNFNISRPIVWWLRMQHAIAWSLGDTSTCLSLAFGALKGLTGACQHRSTPTSVSSSSVCLANKYHAIGSPYQDSIVHQ